jgi:hypothetical protein
MIKTKWLEFSAKHSLAQVADALHKAEFRRGVSRGIELTELLKATIRGKFIEETIDNEIFVDPFGEEVVNSIRRYNIFEFLIIPAKKKRFLLRVTNPPRSLRSFVALLSEQLGFGFSISPLTVDVFRLMQHLRNATDGKNWTVKKIRLTSVRLTESSFAKIDVTSEADAYRDAKNQLSLKNSVLERATIEFSENVHFRHIELSSTGVTVGEADFLDELISDFQSYFDDEGNNN